MQPTKPKIDPERAKALMALYGTIQRSKMAVWVGLAGGAWCLTLWLAMGRTIELGIATAVCFGGALLGDYVHKRARRMWDRLCPCPGCEARRAAEREKAEK